MMIRRGGEIWRDWEGIPQQRRILGTYLYEQTFQSIHLLTHKYLHQRRLTILSTHLSLHTATHPFAHSFIGQPDVGELSGYWLPISTERHIIEEIGGTLSIPTICLQDNVVIARKTYTASNDSSLSNIFASNNKAAIRVIKTWIMLYSRLFPLSGIVCFLFLNRTKWINLFTKANKSSPE